MRMLYQSFFIFAKFEIYLIVLKTVKKIEKGREKHE